MTAAQRLAIIAKIRAVFQQGNPGIVQIGNIVAQGKLYEMKVLSEIVRCLRAHEGCIVSLQGSTTIRFRSSPGKINRQHSFLTVSRAGNILGELMTDLEFLTLSWYLRGAPGVKQYSDYHELDIALIRVGIPDGQSPAYSDVILGAECKDTKMSKGFVRNMLGVRRELSFFRGGGGNPFLNQWPRGQYSSNPASALFLYCRDPKVRNYRSMGSIFDIDMRYLKI